MLLDKPAGIAHCSPLLWHVPAVTSGDMLASSRFPKIYFIAFWCAQRVADDCVRLVNLYCRDLEVHGTPWQQQQDRRIAGSAKSGTRHAVWTMYYNRPVSAQRAVAGRRHTSGGVMSCILVLHIPAGRDIWTKGISLFHDRSLDRKTTARCTPRGGCHPIAAVRRRICIKTKKKRLFRAC